MQNLEKYINKFCSDKKCENDAQNWYQNLKDQTRSDPNYWNKDTLLDPHLCQDSCSTSSPDCIACTNPDYFICNKSKMCVHPSLQCDGHPQCQHGEDEQNCYGQYIKKNIIKHYATFNCKSLLYPGKNYINLFT